MGPYVDCLVGPHECTLGAEFRGQVHSVAISDVRIALQERRDLMVCVEMDTVRLAGERIITQQQERLTAHICAAILAFVSRDNLLRRLLSST
jgi:phosphotransferase system IIA component